MFYGQIGQWEVIGRDRNMEPEPIGGRIADEETRCYKQQRSRGKMMLSLIAVSLLLLHGAVSMCPKTCPPMILSKLTNDGYRASLSVTAPMDYRKHRRLGVIMFFYKAPKKVENLSIRGGSINKAKLNGEKLWLVFRPNQRISKGSNVTIEFLVHSNQMPKITEVQFWHRCACSSTLSPTGNVTTQAPETTSAPEEVTTSAPASTSAPEVSTQAPATTSAPEVTTKQATTKLAQQTTPSGSCTPEFDYGKVLRLSLLFYEAQRSGKLPATNRIPYRKDSALNDRGSKGEDLTGGYYDAGDFVKFNFPMAYTITVLSWGVIQYEDAYKASGEYQNMLDAIKWGTDYFIKCHTAKFELYGQVGDGHVDHAYWGRPEDMTMDRPAFKIDAAKPGSDLAGETAAALAAASIVFKFSMPVYSHTLLKNAKELYEFADKFRGKYSDSIPNAANFYKSWSGFHDELTWAAAWLYRASTEQQYLTAAKSFYLQFGMGSTPGQFSWDDKKAGVQVLMAQITGENMYKTAVDTFCDSIMKKPKTPGGLVYITQWGTNQHAANVAFICLQAADLGIKQTQYRNFARSQIHYMLGKPNSPRSFLVGFGRNPPQRPHHRSSSCPNTPAACSWNDYNSPSPNPQILYGALVGGPGQDGSYVDDRGDYIKNEVACDYNAGFQSAVAGLRHLQNTGEC